MIFYLFVGNVRCDGFVLDHMLTRYSNMLRNSVLTCAVCILLSCLIMFKGASYKVISLTIILGLIFTIFYEDAVLYLIKRSKEDGRVVDTVMSKIYSYLLKVLEFGHNYSYITLCVFLIVSYLLISIIDMSMFLYVAYLASKFFDSLKAIYLKNFSFASIHIIVIIAVVVTYKIVSYAKALIYSLFYSIVGSTCFLVGLEVICDKDWGFATINGDLFDNRDISEYKMTILTQLVFIMISMFIQVKDVYMK
ncbi:hypothetical protein NGRA_2268 [Nosema granulosis]|uniref:Uncharacterized protein n=1 Tax=Nosema granulosis TaxID=83296 RepID=A0A9P6GX07_9MICR|nr:hypothetical protein NGRA_2268 [Nosema granulosis]